MRRLLIMALVALLLVGCATLVTPIGTFNTYFTPNSTLSLTVDPSPTRQFPTSQPLIYITNTTNSVWNIRDEPSAASEDLGDLKVGESIEYLFQVNTGAGWFGVQWEGGTAYISSACCVDRG